MRITRSFTRTTLLLATLVSARSLLAQTAPPAPLTNQIPADVLFAATWAGQDNMPAGFNDTRLKTLLDSLNLSAFWDKTALGTVPAEGRGMPQVQSLLDLAKVVTTYAWQNAGAVYSTGPGITDDLRAEPQLTFLIRFPSEPLAKEAERDIQDRITSIVADQPVPNVRFFRRGTDLALSVNDANDKSPLEPLTSALGSAPAFTDLQHEVKSSTSHNAPASDVAPAADGAPALSIYLNIDKAFALGEEKIAENPDGERNLKIAGLHHAHALLLQGDFEGKDYRTNLFVALDKPSERNGVLGALTALRPAEPTLLAGVPASATAVNSFSLDLDDVFTRLKAEGETFQAGFSQKADAWAGLICGMVSLPLTDFLKNFGKDFALASLPTEDPARFDFVLISKPKDAALAHKHLTSLAGGIQRALMSFRPDLPRFNLTPASAGGAPYGILENDILSPAWAIHKGYIYMTPTKAAMEHALADAAKGSLEQDSSYNSLHTRLAAPAGAAFSFARIAPTAPALLDAWTQMAKAALSSPSGKLPEWTPLVPRPTPEQWSAALAPAASATWTTDNGLHYRSLSPLPGAELFSSTAALVTGPHALQKVLPALAAQFQNAATPKK